MRSIPTRHHQRIRPIAGLSSACGGSSRPPCGPPPDRMARQARAAPRGWPRRSAGSARPPATGVMPDHTALSHGDVHAFERGAQRGRDRAAGHAASLSDLRVAVDDPVAAIWLRVEVPAHRLEQPVPERRIAAGLAVGAANRRFKRARVRLVHATAGQAQLLGTECLPLRRFDGVAADDAVEELGVVVLAGFPSRQSLLSRAPQ